MRYWGQNITISGDWIMYSGEKGDDNTAPNPDAAGFEERMQAVLRYIQPNPVGAIVLNAINAGKHSVSIRPVTEAARNKSSSRQMSMEASKEVGDGPSAKPGPGSSVVIWYNTSGVTYGGHVYRVDDSVLHECFHALRQSCGNWQKTPMDGPYENLEEFLAITVANIYASYAKRPADMRSSHGKAFSSMVLTPEAFRQQFKAQLRVFQSTMRDVYNALAAVKADWNPLPGL